MLEISRKMIFIPSPQPSQMTGTIEEKTLLAELFDMILDPSPHQETGNVMDILQVNPLQSLPQVHPPEYYRNEKNKQQRKRRCINPKNMPEIRVLRRDIRRKYGEMMINVVNNADIPVYEQFFREFGLPDLRTVIRRSVANKLSSAIDVALFNGQYPGSSDLPKLVDAYALNAAMMPDWTFKVKDCQIRMRQGYQGSVIVMKTLMRGTRILSVEPKSSESSVSEYDESASSVYSEILTSDSSLTSYASTLTPNPFEQRSFKRLEEAGYIDRVNYRWVIADPPLDTTAEVIFVMILDEMHHIQQYHIDYNLISEKPVSY